MKFSEYKRGEAIEMRSKLTQKGGPVEEKEGVLKRKRARLRRLEQKDQLQNTAVFTSILATRVLNGGQFDLK